MSAPRKKSSALAKLRGQQFHQLAAACYNAISTMSDALDLIEGGDVDGAKIALLNAIDATRADLTAAKARP